MIASEAGYRQAPPAFGRGPDCDVPAVRGVVVGVLCGLALWGLLAGVALLLLAAGGSGGSAGVRVSPGGMATVYTTNVPDGRCHEDDPCAAVSSAVTP